MIDMYEFGCMNFVAETDIFHEPFKFNGLAYKFKKFHPEKGLFEFEPIVDDGDDCGPDQEV